MPYHIFKVFPNKTTEFIETHSKFHDAKVSAQAMRDALQVADNYKIKIIFAANQQAGAKLLVTEREFVPYGDD